MGCVRLVEPTTRSLIMLPTLKAGDRSVESEYPRVGICIDDAKSRRGSERLLNSVEGPWGHDAQVFNGGLLAARNDDVTRGVVREPPAEHPYRIGHDPLAALRGFVGERQIH